MLYIVLTTNRRGLVMEEVGFLARKMAQLALCLLHKHRTEFDPQDHITRLTVRASVPALERQEQVKLQG